jgi:hypothetical protein
VSESNNLLFLMGGEFSFSNAEDYFKNSEAMIDFYNQNEGKKSNIEVIFSTPSHYIKSINDQDLVWPTRYSDFFPYKDD